jgi:Kef-type K+ transport system membrane component KefB
MTAVITFVSVVAVVLIFEVCCQVDIARAKEVRRLDRETWALICLVTLPLGCILFLALGRNWKARGSAAAPRSPMSRAG